MTSKKVLAGLVSVLFLSTAACAETYYVRNRPFQQVMQVNGEALVGAESFLRAAQLNWTVDGKVVTVVDKPAVNPKLGEGPTTFRYNGREVTLDLSPRGGSSFVSLKPLATLLGYSVTANPSSGTVDVAKARFATEGEKKLVGESTDSRENQKKALNEAWAKKAAQLKEAREAEAKKAEEEANAQQPVDEAAKAEQEKRDAEEAAKAEKAKKEAEVAKELAAAKVRLDNLEAQPAKAARLEVFRNEVIPDPSQGIVTIDIEVRNMGDDLSKPPSGRLFLNGPETSASATETFAVRGPDISVSATDTMAVKKTSIKPSSQVVAEPKPKVEAKKPQPIKTKIFLTKSLSGPALAPGDSWKIHEVYRSPSGNSIPIGNFVADFKLNNTK